MKRRDFLKKTGAGAAAVAAAATISGAPAVHAKKRIKWKMVTTWSPGLDYFQTGADRLAKRVSQMTGGLFQIKVFAANELVPAFGAFEAVSQGTVQAGSGAAYYWAGKVPAAQFFAAVPFGMNAQGMSAWFWGGDGLKLWEEVYAPFNLVPRPAGNTGVQMGGWFNRKIETIDDYKGLKMRIPGLGGKVVAKAGGTVVLTPGGEIFTNLERGVIDATEWVGPLHDKMMGLYKAARYYYYPGWHEPSLVLENFFNKTAYEALPREFQAILDAATRESYGWMWSGFDAGNGAALQSLISDHGVELVRFPDPVMADLKKLTDETVAEFVARDTMARKVHDSYSRMQSQVGAWGTVSEKPYYNQIMPAYSLKK